MKSIYLGAVLLLVGCGSGGADETTYNILDCSESNVTHTDNSSYFPDWSIEGREESTTELVDSILSMPVESYVDRRTAAFCDSAGLCNTLEWHDEKVLVEHCVGVNFEFSDN